MSQEYARIELYIDSANDAKKVVKLKRWQFEAILVILPTLAIWGIASTTMLLWNHILWDDVPKPEVHAIIDRANFHQNDIAQPAVSNYPQIPTQSVVRKNRDSKVSAKIEGFASAVIPTRYVDGVYSIAGKLSFSSSDSTALLDLRVHNLTDTKQDGRMWARAKGITADGKEVWFTSNPELQFNNDGKATNPQRGLRYSFRHMRESSLTLSGPNILVKKFIRAEIGFQRSSGDQSISVIDFL
jgi:hypothetical protein